MVLTAFVITISLFQTALVLACSTGGSANGQGNGNPGGKCESVIKYGTDTRFSSNPKCGGTNAGPEDTSPINL